MSMIRPAQPADESAILALLETCGLPLGGAREHLGNFWVAADGSHLVGTVGFERYGDVALLRSVATHPDWRRRGIAAALCERALAAATRDGIRTVYLLTETAQSYFPRFGFHQIPRSESDPRLAASAEFQGACGDAAVLMVRELR
jgi:N-acetylglutamate synthase-like GNAT family acetyltransferase